MSVDAKDFEVVSSQLVYEKKEIKDIIKECLLIDVKKVAKEVLTWGANNVEEFIDNQRKIFKLDLILDAEDGAVETFPETKKLQDLYRAVPEDPELSVEEIGDGEAMYAMLSDDQKAEFKSIQECRAMLDSITKDAHLAMQAEEELLTALFKRMGFYYEMKGVSNGNLLIEELVGEVDISKFEYESFPVGVKVRSPIIEKMDDEGNISKSGGAVVNEYVIPEGFTVWLELAFRTKQQQRGSMF